MILHEAASSGGSMAPEMVCCLGEMGRWLVVGGLAGSGVEGEFLR